MFLDSANRTDGACRVGLSRQEIAALVEKTTQAYSQARTEVESLEELTQASAPTCL